MWLNDGLGLLIAQLARRAGKLPAVEDIRSTRWASITSSGFRHRLVLRFEGDEPDAACAAVIRDLDHAEFDLGRLWLADIDVIEAASEEDFARVVIEALVMRDA